MGREGYGCFEPALALLTKKLKRRHLMATFAVELFGERPDEIEGIVQ